MASTNNVNGTLIIPSWMNDVDRQTYTTLTTVVGTNAITAVGPLSLASTGYVTGQVFYFNPQNTNSGAVTINVSGLGVRNVTKNGVTPLVAGDLVAGSQAELIYDGAQFQLLNPTTIVFPNQPGRLIGIQVLTGSGNYTPTAGTASVVVHIQASGGGGGIAVATGVGQNSIGNGGHAGAHCIHRATAGFSGAAYVIGAAGGSGAAAADTTFLGVVCKGGPAGAVVGPVNFSATVLNTTSLTSTGANVLNGNTVMGMPGFIMTVNGSIVGGAGGPSIFGQGGQGSPVGTGQAAVSPGSGGGGAAAAASSAAQAGGAGAAGRIIVYEYA